MREFFPGLKNKHCGEEYMATCADLQHKKYLVIGPCTNSKGLWSQIINQRK